MCTLIFFFFTKKLIILSPFVFFRTFLRTFDFRMITLQKNVSKNNGFLIAEKPVAVALIGGKEFFLFSWLEHSGFSQNIFAMKLKFVPLSLFSRLMLFNTAG